MQGLRQRVWVRVTTSEEEALVLGWNVGGGMRVTGSMPTLTLSKM
mgnify:CR=1 FL=1